MVTAEFLKSEEKLKELRKLGVKYIEFGNDGLVYKLEFFPSTIDEAVEFKKKESKRNEATGLTPEESRDLLNMDE